jgi:multicomponent Na+:H+ antiporter subunit D
MIAELSPGLILIVGAALVPLLRGRLRTAYMLALPIVALFWLAGAPEGEFGRFEVFGQPLVTLRIDRLSSVFGIIFLIAAFLGLLYASHLKGALQHVAALVYAGSAISAVFAGDLITLFVFWEGTAISSVFLIWARGTESAYRAGMRYLIVQVGSGVLLIAGIVAQLGATGSIAFGQIGVGTLAGNLIFVAFGIKCAFPLLHTWLQDAYPNATVSGTVILSAFTTKLAIYALARGYAGTDILIPIGAVMAVFPIYYGLIASDLRRVLSYALICQLGFMVVGIGIGTELSLNGTTSHALASILYKALLFMATGAVLHRVGTIEASDLGGLYKSMPWTAGFCIVGAASISALPLFSGFVSKGMTVDAAMYEGHFWTWIALMAASVGVFHFTAIRVPYLAFFGRDSGIRCEEAPGNMLVAMGITAALCFLIGVAPGAMYAILPFPVEYEPYTLGHVVTQLQLLAFAGLAFVVLLRFNLYPPAMRSTNLEFDWLFRVPLKWMAERLAGGVAVSSDEFSHLRQLAGRELVAQLYVVLGPQGHLARTWTIGFSVLLMTVVLAVGLMFNFLGSPPEPL